MTGKKSASSPVSISDAIANKIKEVDINRLLFFVMVLLGSALVGGIAIIDRAQSRQSTQAILYTTTVTPVSGTATKTPYPTFVAPPAMTMNVYYPVQVLTTNRGYTNGVLKTVTVRNKPDIAGVKIAEIVPNVIVTCDWYKDYGLNTWCKVSAQSEWYMPLTYNGTTFASLYK